MVDEQEAELLEGHLDLNNALAGLFAMGSGSLPARAAPLDATQVRGKEGRPRPSRRRAKLVGCTVWYVSA